MKRWYAGLLVGMAWGLSACSSYYYSTLRSDDGTGIRDEAGDFVQENDTVRISYSFNGEDAPISITVQNKSEVPLFVDWTRSSLIIDETATSYYDTNMPVSGSTESQSVAMGDGYHDSEGSFDGHLSVPKGIDFIPPRSRVERAPLRLSAFTFDEIPKEAYVVEQMKVASGSTVKVRSKTFTEADSPLRFRSYLTLYAGDLQGTARKTMVFERQFYVSRLLKTGNVPPDRLEEGQRRSGDLFYVHKKKGGKLGGILMGSIAVGATAGAVSVVIGGHSTVDDMIK